MGVGGQSHASAAITLEKDPVPIVQEAGWAPGPVWISAENLAPPGFDPRTFQPVASGYTDYAIPAPSLPPKTKGKSQQCVSSDLSDHLENKPKFLSKWQ